MNKLKLLLLSFLLLTIVTIAIGQEVRFNVLHTVVDEIASANVYETSYTVGYAGSLSNQYARYKQLLSLANDQQLIDLATNHKNAVVRLYSLKALRHKKTLIPLNLLQKFQNDIEKVIQISGCLGGEVTVNSLLFINIIREHTLAAEIEQ